MPIPETAILPVPERHHFDGIVIGGGAAGLMCAIEAGRRGRRVALLERAERVGKKILISGGGRCNFTNLHCRPENFLSANPHFARSALARYTPADFIALVEKHGIAYHEKTLGQLFCDGSAQQIVDMLLRECAAANVHIFLSQNIHEVEQDTGHHHFVVRTHTAAYSAPALVVATGGLSIPKIGATGFGYDLARQFGLSTLDCRPGLVPLVLDERDQSSFCDLAGISAEVVASTGKRTFREKLLITHRGLSGPAILQISSYWNGFAPVLIDWAGGREILAPLRSPHSHRDLASAKFALRQNLPGRLAERLIDIAAPVSSPNQRTNSLTNHAISELERRLHAWAFTPAGSEGYAKAEVTAGGVNTDALSAKTMECRHVPGLYFIGEVVDVTGQLGGFNFQWAWASGAAAGRAL